jgi:rhodanese-related sulfurtransferase
MNLFTHVRQLPALQSHLWAAGYERFHIEGAKIALAGVPQEDILPVIRGIMRNAEDVPLSTAGGAWAQPSSGQSISPREFKQLLDERSDDPDVVVLDIRTPREFKSGHIRGAQLLDYYSSDFVDKLKRLDREKTYLVYCRSGNRSGKSLKIFERLGFRQVYHLETGIVG